MHPEHVVEVRRHRGDSPWSYLQLDQRQREIAERVRSGGEGALLLSEVAPVITLGRRATDQEIFFAPELLARRGIEVLRTDRGGLATYHGPGQWVLFAVDSLERLTGDRRGVRKAVDGLLEVALRVCRELQPEARLGEGEELGIWGPSGKLAAVGVHVEQGVLLHGLSLNGFRTGESFFGLRPCGLDKPVGFLLDGQPMAEHSGLFESLGERLVAEAKSVFWQAEAVPGLRKGAPHLLVESRVIS